MTMKNFLHFCVLLMGMFIFFSLMTSIVHFLNNRTTNVEIDMIQSEGNESWLLISIVACTPSFLICSIDLLNEFLLTCKMKNLPSQLAEKIIQAMKIITILAPNCVHYSMLCFQFSALEWMNQIQDEILFAQSFAFISFVIFGIVSRSGNFCSSLELNTSVERLAIIFLTALATFKLFLLLSLLNLNNSVNFLFLLLSYICLSLGIVTLLFLSFKLSMFFSQQVKESTAWKFSMTHDFYRLLGATLFALYSFAVFIQANQFLSPYSSGSSKLYLIGQTLMVIYMNVVDHLCVTFEANWKGEQLLTRLNLIRYISHEMRSPLNTSFLGLQIVRGHVNSAMETLRKCRSVLRKLGSKNDELLAKCLASSRQLSRVLQELEEVQETTDLVKESSNIALETLNDLLTFDKIDDKKLSLEVEEMDMWTFVMETVRPFRINAVKEQIALTCDCVDAECRWTDRFFVKADKFKLKQVLRNFLSNAMKFCDKFKGEVNIVVERRQSVHQVRASEGFSEAVRVTVTDNGCGISEEDQKRLFGQYVQFNASALQQGQGSGLGLWICKSEKYTEYYYFFPCKFYPFLCVFKVHTLANDRLMQRRSFLTSFNLNA